MELHTSQPQHAVEKRLEVGHVGAIKIGPLRQNQGRTGGDWAHGVFSIRALDAEDRRDLHELYGLPETLQTRVWLVTQPVSKGQTAVYEMTAHLLKEWPGDLAVLFNGDYLMLKRVNGQLSIKTEGLKPVELEFFKGVEYTAPRTDDGS